MEEPGLSDLFNPFPISPTSIDHSNVADQKHAAIGTPNIWVKSVSTQIPEYPDAQSEIIVLGVLLQPEYLSPVIARADVLYDSDTAGSEIPTSEIGCIGEFLSYKTSRRLIVSNIPRNPRRDQAVEQSIWVSRKTPSQGEEASSNSGLLVVVVPHIQNPTMEWPFYLPDVRALAIEISGSMLSIHHLARARSTLCREKGFNTTTAPADSDRSRRMFKRILEVLRKRFENPNYIKRVTHDAVVARERYQKVYQDLKARHADRLCRIFATNGYEGKGCREVDKIFEELGIASFCICLWEDLYEIPSTALRTGFYGETVRKTDHEPRNRFVGFADLGCGSGVLTDVLLQEGWPGYGIDARSRKIWKSFDDNVRCHLVESILIPYVIDQTQDGSKGVHEKAHGTQVNPFYTIPGSPHTYHSGHFTEGTFLICNHGDELTAWTPLLASLSRSPFIVVPCCSFNLAGRRFRAQRPLCQIEGGKSRESSKRSTYQLLINYVEDLCREIGVATQREWLRIPSTRNLAIIGRGYGSTLKELTSENSRETIVKEIIRREGGTEGWNAMVARLKERRQPSCADDDHSQCC